ncbi:Major facilitator superfamily domain, general substrate transporter [Pleurostoma richardsiae]|uniref:Major facilitator superfamily domain, general substrate transporter n=1 Tax=Pleurostoma richardsiae TaxID=41990 RepID=A0AA38R8Q5_9PEZI|nr:Major facilitator superfamily domain, general substrate transporter [Pleurostoma richardsiae]
MAEKRSNTRVDLTYSLPTHDQHDGAAIPVNIQKMTESMEQGSDPPDEPQDHEYLAGLRLFLVLSGLTLAIFLMLLDASIVATAVPTITSDFHSLEDIGWYGTAYLLTNCACQPLSGKIYSYFNVKWTFLCFFALFELGSALCGAAQSSAMLIIGRAVAGMGASGLLNGGYTILALIVPTSKQATLRGVLIGLSFFGLLAGPLVGGAFTSNATWRWCFYLNLPCGAVIALFIIVIPIPDYRVAGDGTQTALERLKKLDITGFLLFGPTVVMLILALQWGGTRYVWSSATIIGLFCGSFGNLLAFLVWEYHVGAEALIPLALLRRRVIWTSCLNMAFLIGCTITTAYYFPVWFQAVRDETPVQSGVDMLPIIGTNTVVTMITGAMIGRVGYYTPFALASGLFTAVGSGLVTTIRPGSSRSRRIGFQILQGMQGLGFQVPILAVQNGVRREEVSVANALVVFAQNLSAAVFLSLGEVIFSTELHRFLELYAPGADAEAIVAAGAAAAEMRATVPPELLPQVEHAYSDTFDRVMYLATASAAAAFLVALCMGWVRMKVATPVPK